MKGLICVVLVIVALIMPFVATLLEIYFLIHAILNRAENERYQGWSERHPKLSRFNRAIGVKACLFEAIMIAIALIYENWYMDLIHDVVWKANWQTQLVNRQLHQPINTEYAVAVAMIGLLYIAGMTILHLSDVNKLPPLVTALSISALYIGSIYCIIWTYHVVKSMPGDGLLLLLPFNICLISLRLILSKVTCYKPSESRMSRIEESQLLSWIYEFKDRALFLPVYALVLTLPLLGIMCLVLVLLGQAPDAAIKAFTETSDFRLSTKVSPQNVTMDEHYLCTVAAGGDAKVVKPIRKGIRHGHEVTVNRQLQVANAFEEIIMVRTPGFHARLRRFYDTYGFPVAKLIKKRWVADLVYIIMKPLELLFLITIYLCEVHPEDRISLQYTGRTLETFYE